MSSCCENLADALRVENVNSVTPGGLRSSVICCSADNINADRAEVLTVERRDAEFAQSLAVIDGRVAQLCFQRSRGTSSLSFAMRRRA